jgi:hypothetical protein
LAAEQLAVNRDTISRTQHHFVAGLQFGDGRFDFTLIGLKAVRGGGRQRKERA